MKINIIPVLKDNYCYALRFGNGQCAVIDPGEAQPVLDYLDKNDGRLDLIINTHHHGDHTAGNAALREKYACPVAAPAQEAEKIGGVDLKLAAATTLDFGGESGQILETPGHTLGGICLYYPASNALFCGDTLFSMGCGRLFEGTPAQMWQSLSQLLTLPDTTLIYPGHEYTQSNAQFCLRHDPDNTALQTRAAQVAELRAQDKPTIPVSLATEKKTNIFLRAGNAETFARLRAAKDNA